MNRPVVGYTGFTPIIESSNVFAKGYQKCFKISKSYTTERYKKRTRSSIPRKNFKSGKINDEEEKETSEVVLTTKQKENNRSKFQRVFSNSLVYPRISNPEIVNHAVRY